mgnify:CR=1 FL=1
MKNRKLSSRAVISLVLSAVLFTMPAVAFSVNGNYALSAFAEETKETEESKPEESMEQTPGESETEGRKIQKIAPREAPKKLRKAVRREAPKKIQKAVPTKALGMALYREMISRSLYATAKINAVRMSMIKTVRSVLQIISSVPIKNRMSVSRSDSRRSGIMTLFPFLSV